MATVHSMSMLTNSCVKPPINPQTGVPFAHYERSNSGPTSAWVDEQNGSGDRLEVTNGASVNFGTANFDKQQDLTDLPDDMFYQRLMQLKDEHKKTLELCEKLYTEKMESSVRSSERSRSPSPVRSIHTPTRSISPIPRSFSPGLRSPSPIGSTHSLPGSAHRHRNNNLPFSSTQSIPGTYSANTTPMKPPPRDMVRDMSASKPPLPKKCSGNPQVRPGSASGLRSQEWARDSANSSVDGEFMRSGDAGRSQDADIRALLNDSQVSHQSALSKISDMWENFSVDDYTPRRTRARKSASNGSMRRRSNSLSRLDTKKDEEEEEWSHRITIPKPFNMTKRDEAKIKTKSQAAIELEQKRAEQERLEEEECQKKFKAKPVPAHVYMPLYNEIVEEQETRRRVNRQRSEEFTKTVQKPFKFSTREAEMKSKVQRASQIKEYDDTPKKEFRAQPFPEHLFGYTVYDKLAEEEEYRRIRAQMRSKELLQKSSLPPNMASRGRDYTHSKSRQKAHAQKAQKAKKAGLIEDFNFKPRVNDDVPDFEELHRKFLTELGRKKGQKEATVCKPFNLRTSRIPSTKHKIYDDIARDEAAMREQNWQFKSSARKSRTGGMSSHLSTSWDSIPAKMTNSASLRTSANKQRMEQKMAEEIAALEAERRKRLKQRQLQKEVTERALANDHTTDLTQSKINKLKQHRAQERAQEEEYRRYLNEIQERVDQRPLLFEQTAQENARRTAEKRYAATLQRAGIAPDSLHSDAADASTVPPHGSTRSSRTASRRSSYSRGGQSRSGSRSRSRSRSRSPATQSKSLGTGTGKYSDDFDDTHGSDGGELEQD